MSTYVASVSLVTMHCSCGGTFAINEAFRADALRQDRQWFCPYCGGKWNTGGGENERLRRELKAEREARERAQERALEERRRADGYKGQTAKIKKRIAGGVCPCCHRTFQNLGRHMKGQHPEFSATETKAAP